MDTSSSSKRPSTSNIPTCVPCQIVEKKYCPGCSLSICFPTKKNIECYIYVRSLFGHVILKELLDDMLRLGCFYGVPDFALLWVRFKMTNYCKHKNLKWKLQDLTSKIEEMEDIVGPMDRQMRMIKCNYIQKLITNIGLLTHPLECVEAKLDDLDGRIAEAHKLVEKGFKLADKLIDCVSANRRRIKALEDYLAHDDEHGDDDGDVAGVEDGHGNNDT